MALLRGIVFTLLFYSITGVMAIMGIPTLLMPRAGLFYWQRLWVHITIWLLRVVCGITHRIDGTPSTQPVIYAIKHQSAWEAVVLFDYLVAPVVVLKRSLLFLPIFGFYLLHIGVIAIDRARGATALQRILNQSQRMVGKGRSIMIFPQGTRVAPEQHSRYHSGVYAIYADCRLPVIPVALNSGYFWPRNAWRKNSGQIRVKFLPAIPPGLSRQVFMRRLEEAIEAESTALAAKQKE